MLKLTAYNSFDFSLLKDTQLGTGQSNLSKLLMEKAKQKHDYIISTFSIYQTQNHFNGDEHSLV